MCLVARGTNASAHRGSRNKWTNDTSIRGGRGIDTDLSLLFSLYLQYRTPTDEKKRRKLKKTQKLSLPLSLCLSTLSFFHLLYTFSNFSHSPSRSVDLQIPLVGYRTHPFTVKFIKCPTHSTTDGRSRNSFCILFLLNRQILSLSHSRFSRFSRFSLDSAHSRFCVSLQLGPRLWKLIGSTWNEVPGGGGGGRQGFIRIEERSRVANACAGMWFFNGRTRGSIWDLVRVYIHTYTYYIIYNIARAGYIRISENLYRDISCRGDRRSRTKLHII